MKAPLFEFLLVISKELVPISEQCFSFETSKEGVLSYDIFTLCQANIFQVIKVDVFYT